MTEKKRIGVIVAEEVELEPMTEWLSRYHKNDYTWFSHRGFSIELDQAEVLFAVSGVGKVNAAMAATDLIHRGCVVLLNFGMSGGIGHVSRGDLVLVDRCAEHDFDLTVIGYQPFEKPAQQYIYHADPQLNQLAYDAIPGVKCGMAVSGDSFICNEEKRTELRNDFDAYSCDMETAAIASVAFMAGIPFAALRRISDDAGEDALTEHRTMNQAVETNLTDAFCNWLLVITKNTNKFS
ncbi:MAG: 5'-methylthioadenosine/S-adenosylhomocysteine nucleosidase [Clostridia bacterium]|nr:5'-methylthioadenosine/S-adenosylhomocysteine nucleosidase [Clostridia bacterium]